jgi:hypothetical protein
MLASERAVNMPVRGRDRAARNSSESKSSSSMPSGISVSASAIRSIGWPTSRSTRLMPRTQRRSAVERAAVHGRERGRDQLRAAVHLVGGQADVEPVEPERLRDLDASSSVNGLPVTRWISSPTSQP